MHKCLRRALLAVAILAVPLPAQRLEKIIRLPRPPARGVLNPEDQKYYVTDLWPNDSAKLMVIDCVTESLIRVIPAQFYGDYPGMLWTPNRDKLYNIYSWDSVEVFDARNDSVVAWVPCSGFEQTNWGYNRKEHMIYLTYAPPVVVYAISEDSDSLLGTYEGYGAAPFWNSVNDRMYWSYTQGSHAYLDVRKSGYDTVTIRRIEAPLQSGHSGSALWIRAMDTTMNVLIGTYDSANYANEFAAVVDANRDTVLALYPFPAYWFDVVMNPRHHKAYLAVENGIYVLDYVNGTLTGLPIGYPLYDIGVPAYSARSDRLYVSNGYGGWSEMVVIDCTTDSIIGRFEPPYGIGGFAVDPLLNKLYINGYHLNHGMPTDSVVQVYVESLPSAVASPEAPGVVHVLTLSPNPAHDHFTVSTAKQPQELSIYDAAGVLVRREVPSGNRVSLHGIVPGVYFVEARSGETKQRAKLIVR